jgi:hypothetical protein
MRLALIGVALFVFLSVVAWGMAQPSGEKTPAIRYQFYPTQMTIVMFDGQTGKTWALAPASFGRDEFAWVPIRKFDDEEAYRRWLQENRDKMFKDKTTKDKVAKDKKS